MYIIKKSLLLMFMLVLTACTVASLNFNKLDYPVTSKPVMGKLVLIIPSAAAQRQFTVPASAAKAANDQVILAGQLLVAVADYEYPKIFTGYDRVPSTAAILPGFYRAMMRLTVTSFIVEHHVVHVTLHADMYSYQGKLLYEKSFDGQAQVDTTLQAATLSAYRDAIQQVNDRLEQLLYWEDHADTDHGNH
jgi:hypothetical protein